jgi:hypothetical protein
MRGQMETWSVGSGAPVGAREQTNTFVGLQQIAISICCTFCKKMYNKVDFVPKVCSKLRSSYRKPGKNQAPSNSTKTHG